MTRDSITQLTAAGLLVASMVASVWSSAGVAASFGRAKLGYADRAEDSDPPEVGLGIAMGAFRGMFVNYLWLRANKAKERGNFYEAVDLAKTITKLQPRFPRVWAFHAWNMAYNISVTTQTAPERWQWVSAGIRILRDEGIPANPNDLLIHKELAWIFMHKIQGVMDDANQYYKREFALEWNIVLGTPPRADARDRTREQTIDEYVKWLERVANAKDTLEEVEAATPVARKLIDRIRTETGLDVTDNEGRKRILKAIEIGRSLGRLATALKGTGVPQLGGPLAKLLSDPELFPGWEVLSPHLRKRLLVDGYHMEPERMIAYTRQFGPLDWRHASAHAIYWAQRGVDESQLRVGKLNAGDFDFLNTDRVVIQAVQDLYRSGTIYFDVVKPESYLAINNGNFIPTYREALVAMLDREAKQFEITRNNDMRNNPFNQYRAGYENFMRDAIAYTYRRGDKEGAGKLQIQLLADFKRNKLNWNDPSLEDQLQMPLDQFVVEQIKERITSPDVARSEVYAGLFGAFLSLLNDDTPLYQTQFQYAKDFHKAFFDEQYRQTNVDASKARMEVMPHDWTTCATLILMTGVMQALGVQEAAIIYGRLPEEEIRCMAYDEMAREMKQGLDAQAKAGRGPTFDQLFPPPPSLAEYRARKAAEQISAPRKSGAELK